MSGNEEAAMNGNDSKPTLNILRRGLPAALLLGLLLAHVAGQAAEPPPALPDGALVVVEAPDFKSLKAAWDGSAPRTAWEASAALELFRRSRLFLKLEDRRALLSQAAGTELDEAFLDGLQAGRTIGALYDPARREALLMVELAHGGGGAALATLLQSLPELKHLGQTFRGRYLEEDKVFLGAFQAGNRLYLATSERLLQEVIRISQEGGGYRLPEFPAGPASLHLDVDLLGIRKTGYFRRYWLPEDNAGWAPYDRELLVLAATPDGWQERRLLVEHAGNIPAWPATAAFPAAADLGPAWGIQAGLPADAVAELLLGGILRLPADRRAELRPKDLYNTAVGGESAAPASDLELSVNQPPPVTDKDPLFAGAAAPGDDLRAFLEEGGPWAVRWAWDLRRDAATGNWTRQEFALTLQGAGATPAGAARLRELLGRALAAAYLCNPSSVTWDGPAHTASTGHCLTPAEVLLEAPESGGILLATSAGQLERARRLAGISADTPLAARLAVGDAAARYGEFLKDLGRADKPAGQEEPRFMEDVIPSLLQVLGRVAEVRILRAPSPGGLYEQVTYILKQ
jgi:hypothetical protein